MYLCIANPLSGQLLADGLQMADADPLIDKSPSFLDKVGEAVVKLLIVKALDIRDQC